jgi:Xaa-Pro aminopeptidase
VFVTDFRYVERAERQVGDVFERAIAAQRIVPELVSRLSGRVGYDDKLTSVASLRDIERSLPQGAELVAAPGLVERLRRVKDEAEQAAIAEAAKLADAAYVWALERGLEGRTEIEVARATEARIRELGGQPSFPAIVAAGANGALPHAEPSERPIAGGDLVVFDMGAILDGYCSDCTRTFAVGEVAGQPAEVYEIVRTAQQAALEAIRPGIGGVEADEVARALIRDAGYGDEFGHGLGHGVGLEVHEAPRLGPRSEDTLAAGEAVTVEPGIYLPGTFGVRIEDLVVVTEDGHRNLSGLPKDLTSVA